jgi:FixJ family two-component response regulator
MRGWLGPTKQIFGASRQDVAAATWLVARPPVTGAKLGYALANSKIIGGTSLSEQKLIAVIDDDPEILESVELLLSCHGYDTKLFASAEELLCVAPTLEAACLIVDIQLGGISGLELVRALCADGFTLPVIFITGSRDELHRRRALELGCAAFLLKPFTADRLIETVEKAIVARLG